nr:hypothetical protein [Tanacetum cinerariifolium]
WWCAVGGVGSVAVEMVRRWWCGEDVEGGDDGSNDGDDVDGGGEGGWHSGGVGWWGWKLARGLRNLAGTRVDVCEGYVKMK